MVKKTRSTRKSDSKSASRGHETTQSGAEKSSSNKELAIGATVRVSRLDTLKGCRSELGRLYRESRRREGRFPDALTAKRLSDILGSVRSALELEDLEVRLKALEEKVPYSRGRY